MNGPQFDIERATNGFIFALYLAAAIFLLVMIYFVVRDMDKRQAERQGAVLDAPIEVQDATAHAPRMHSPSAGSVSLRVGSSHRRNA